MKIASWQFPRWSWAFPSGSHHQLVRAAIGAHDLQSLEAARAWLTAHDIDEARFRDQRLWLAIVARFGPALRDHPAYPRLVGLQRMLWTKSQLAIQEATASLGSLRSSGIEVLLIKGASRLSLNESAGKQRIARDIDIVVRPQCMERAFDILIADQWIPSPGNSPQYLRERLGSTRGINMIRGDFGDLDLHSRPFHPGQGGEQEDNALWSSAQAVSFAGNGLLVPCCEDRIALALAHGGLDGHVHSDWLVDCGQTLHSEPCNWDRLQEILLSRSLSVPGAITFHYLRDKLDFDVPADFLDRLSRAATRHPVSMYFGMIQVRPKDRTGPLGQVLRGIAKKRRKSAAVKQMPARTKDHKLEVRQVRSAKESGAGEFVKSYHLDRSPQCKQQSTLEVGILLDVQTTSVRRRIEMEIVSANSHLCRIRFKQLVKKQGPIRLRLRGTIPNPAPDEPLELVARPSRQLRRYASATERQRYGRLPFRVVSCHVR